MRQQYSMAFIGGSLLRQESLDVANLYLQLQDWDLVKEKVIADNILQSKRVSSAKRFTTEIISRLSVLDSEQLEFFVGASIQEQAHTLWLAICRRYDFIAEFAVELLHEHYVYLRGEVSQEDFEAFINKKSEWHPEIDKLTDSSRNKVRQIIFRILKQAEILDKNNQIISVILSGSMREALSINESELLFFPVIGE